MAKQATEEEPDELADFEQWAGELGTSLAAVVEKAGVADFKQNRASKGRVRRGEAPRVRKALLEVFADIERKRDKPTVVGARVMGLEEWRDLGEQVARLDPGKFSELLSGLRAIARKTVADKLAAEGEAAFTSPK